VYLLDIIGLVEDGELELSWTYFTQAHDEEQAAAAGQVTPGPQSCSSPCTTSSSTASRGGSCSKIWRPSTVLTGLLLDGLTGWLDRPFALFGHSMGALVAFELATSLRATGLEPVHFFAAGCRAPHLPAAWPTDRHTLADRDFIDVLRELNGIPGEILEDAEWMEVVLPTLRSDFKLVETYRHRPQAPLRCPLSVIGGGHDAEVPTEGLEGWARHTSGRFEVHVLPGDHFFVSSARSELLGIVAAGLDG
jgi:medium-chain acyl-[acyl-carrier-protein] hydrolase